MQLAKTPLTLLLTAGTILSTTAIAQTADGTQTTAAASADQNAEQMNEVVVTGSRIARPDFEAPNPIVSLDAANLQQSGNTNITNFLARVPALTGSRDSTQTSGGQGTYGTFGQTGLNQLNLRNLGTAR